MEHSAATEDLPQLGAALRGLPALRHFRLHVESLSPHLLSLRAALRRCSPTYLALQSCDLGGLDEPLPESLEVVILDGSRQLRLQEWPPPLAALPLPHSQP